MRTIWLMLIFCVFALFARAQIKTNGVDLDKLGKLQFEASPSLSVLFYGTNVDLGPNLKLTLKKNRIRCGVFGEYFKYKVNSENIFQTGIFGEYSPFVIDWTNPYGFIQLGNIFGGINSGLSLGVGLGTEFLVPVSDKHSLKFFTEFTLNRFGEKINIGTRIVI